MDEQEPARQVSFRFPFVHLRVVAPLSVYDEPELVDAARQEDRSGEQRPPVLVLRRRQRRSSFRLFFRARSQEERPRYGKNKRVKRKTEQSGICVIDKRRTQVKVWSINHLSLGRAGQVWVGSLYRGVRFLEGLRGTRDKKKTPNTKFLQSCAHLCCLVPSVVVMT